MNYHVVAVSRSEKHSFSKENLDSINLIENFDVEGDAHAGKTVQHIFLTRKDTARKNLGKFDKKVKNTNNTRVTCKDEYIIGEG